jgi:tetratricopeptide (TPR) repeat protein
MLNRVFLLLLFCCCVQAIAQNSGKQDSLLHAISISTDAKTKIKTYINLCDEVESINPQLAIKYYQQAIDMAAKADEELLKATCLLNLSVIYYTLSNLPDAMDASQQASRIAQKNDYKIQLATALEGIGAIYYDIGDKKKCSEVFFSSLRIYEQLADKNGINRILSRIGVLYYDQKDYGKAIEYLTKSLSLVRAINDQEGIGANLNNLANVMLDKQEYTHALKYYMEALQISEKNNNLPFKATYLLNIGKTYFLMKQYSKAMYFYTQALNMFEKLDNHRRVAIARIRIGELCLEEKNLVQSLNNAEVALKIGMQHNLKEIIYQSASLLHNVYLARKDTNLAYKYTIFENQWKDSLALNEKEKNLASVEMQYHFEKKEQDELVTRQRRSAINTVVIVFMALVIIIILLILNQLRLKSKKSRLEKQSLEKELDFKKKELTLNVMSLMKQNEMLSEISDKIVRIEKESVHQETRDALKRVGKEVQKSTEHETLKEFSLRFKEVHKDFYDVLLARFPDLTPSDLKLCAFLRLNMTSKEISELTGQQLNTLENARYRLRQKFGISNSDVNLVTFLTQI